MKLDQFRKWFNRDFWRAFQQRTFPIQIPATVVERDEKVRSVYDSIFSARYAASIPEAEIVMNKGYGVARTVPVFCIEDYIVYYFCIKELEDVLCVNRTPNTFGGWTLGGKLRKLEDGEIDADNGFSTARYSFNPRAWTTAFGEFNSLLFAQLETGSYSHVLQFDLSNFYDSIRLDILERWIREQADQSKGWIIALLFYFLNQWNRRNTGLHPQAVGIPQDALADCSRVLANFYLQRYDKLAAGVCSEVDANYFRYADDQMVLLKGKADAERLMLVLTRHLDRFGLRVNQKKVDLWSVDKLQAHRCRTIQAIFSNKGDNQNSKLIRKFAEKFLAIPKTKLRKTWNGGLPLLNRLLWSKLETIPKNLFEELMRRYLVKDYLLRADADKLKRLESLNTISEKPVDFYLLLKDIGQECVHNAFHWEVLSFARNTGNKSLVAEFDARLKELDRFMLYNVVT